MQIMRGRAEGEEGRRHADHERKGRGGGRKETGRS